MSAFFIANNVWFGQNKKTGYYKRQAWGPIGRIIADNARTGTELFITGRLDQYRYENDKGDIVYDEYFFPIFRHPVSSYSIEGTRPVDKKPEGNCS